MTTRPSSRWRLSQSEVSCLWRKDIASTSVWACHGKPWIILELFGIGKGLPHLLRRLLWRSAQEHRNARRLERSFSRFQTQILHTAAADTVDRRFQRNLLR